MWIRSICRGCQEGQDDAKTQRGDLGLFLRRAGDGGWSGLVGAALLGAGKLLTAHACVAYVPRDILEASGEFGAFGKSRVAGSEPEPRFSIGPPQGALGVATTLFSFAAIGVCV